MRRVQSSIYGACPGAGPTVVLQPASPAAESSRFGRQRRSSLVFMPCPPDTPTRSDSLLKIQRAASSICSVTGWDYAPPLAGDLDDVAAHDNLKAVQQLSSAPSFRSSVDELENRRSWDSEEAGPSDDRVSCFVANSPARGGARSCAELAVGLPSPSPSPSAYRSKSFVGAFDLPVACSCSALPAEEWLGAELSRQAQVLPSLLSPPPSPRYSASRVRLHGGFGTGSASEAAGPGVLGGGELRALYGLRRTRRVWESMDMLAE